MEGLMLKMKLQYSGSLMLRANSLLNGQEFEKTRGDSEGQGGLACCSSWGCKGKIKLWPISKEELKRLLMKV